LRSRRRVSREICAAMNKGDDHRNRLFVYGSLLSPAERIRLLGRAIEASPARLSGYERGRKRYFYVTKREGAEVPGALVAGLNDDEIAILDEYEEVPRLYTRELVNVLDLSGAAVECWIYLPTSWAEGNA
jgi:gamma-glutamylcyclotransferase (GGCT)/AIG2-like uncharacterized protein YtfP